MSNGTLQQLKLLTSIIEQENDPDVMMQAIVDAAREVFVADNAWLLYPCVPDTSSCRLTYSSCRQNTPCYLYRHKDIYVKSDLRNQFQELQDAKKTAIHRGDNCRICTELCSDETGSCSQMTMILKMKNDRPWLFGLCDCSGRHWSTDEQDMFQLTGERLRYAYDTVRYQETVQRDIAKRQKVEAEILRGEQRFRSLFQHSSISLWMLDVTRLREDAGRKMIGNSWQGDTLLNDLEIRLLSRLIRVVDVNLATLELFAAHDKEHLLFSLHSLLNDNARSAFKEVLLAILYGKQHFSLETELLKVTGGAVAVILNVDVLPAPDSHMVLISVTDISDRKKAEEKRRLLSTAVEQSAESVVITDPQGIIEYINPAYERVTGYTKKEIIGKKPSILKSGKMPEYQYRLLWQEITEGRVWRGKLLNKKKDGSPFTEDVIITPVKNRRNEITHFVAVKRDITRQDQLEKLVRQSQKMQAIGTLAGGIAHDFNNILTAILGFAELSEILCRDDDYVLKNNLSEIITASERAGNLIDQILTFSRQTEKNVSSLRIDPIVKEVLKLLRASLPANIEILIDIRSKAMVRADPTQIHQVVMNLCTNAFQAIGDQNGWIRVTLDNTRLGTHEGVNLGNLPAGPYITLKVEDNGRGIAKEHINRIYEPYFTTRDKNEGTGLGLSVVHGIINDHGGAIDAHSRPGKGSCFTVYLPQILETEKTESVKDVEFLKGQGRILLVDDEQQIIDYEVQALEKAGYVTYATTSSREALSIFNKHAQTLDLVITDMAMPEMTGLQLFQEIRKIHQDIPVLLCTGYSEHVTADSSKNIGIDGYLAKPFTAEQLAGEVYRLLFSKK